LGTIILVEIDQKSVMYYDSLTEPRAEQEQFTQISKRQGRSTDGRGKWKAYLQVLHYLEKRAEVEEHDFSKEDWKFRRWNPPAKLQRDGYNYGVFVCCFAIYLMQTGYLGNMPFNYQGGSIGRY
jgi:hypothetical protein